MKNRRNTRRGRAKRWTVNVFGDCRRVKGWQIHVRPHRRTGWICNGWASPIGAIKYFSSRAAAMRCADGWTRTSRAAVIRINAIDDPMVMAVGFGYVIS